MRKMFRIIWLFGILILFATQFGLAEEKQKNNSFPGEINISLGKEFLSYYERESETKTKSSALAKNVILKFDAHANWKHSLFGLKGVIPTTTTGTKEEWDSLGFSNYQKNNMEYEWIRYDGYFGYSFYHEEQSLFYTFYYGLRWSKATLERSDFSIFKIPQDINRSTEEVKSSGLLLGLKGEGNFKEKLEDYQYRNKKDEPPPKWGGGWGIETIIPLQAKLTNSTIPGITFKNKAGYTFELNGLLRYYILPEQLSFDTRVNIGTMYWKGSDWKNTIYGRTRWPKNNTSYFLITLGLNWRF